MPTLTLQLPADLLALLDQELSILRTRAPQARLTRSAYLGTILLTALASARRAHQARAAALLDQYLPVVRAVAAKWFTRTKGAIPLEELQSAAYEEAAKAIQRAVPGFSPAAFLRQQAHYACLHLVQERLAEAQQEIRPDQDEGRWERLGDVDQGQVDDQGLQEHLAAFARTLDGPHRAALRALLREDDHPLVADVRAQLAAYLRDRGVDHQGDEELTVAQAAERYDLSPKALGKALRAGRLRGHRIDGEWTIYAADLRAWVALNTDGR